MKVRGLWEDGFGFVPHKVWVGERADKGGTLYLRWRPVGKGNWRWRSLGVKLRDEKGKLLPHVMQMAREAARDQYERLTGKLVGAKATLTPLTLHGTWPLLIDSGTGLYPHDSQHRKEVHGALQFASRVLGPDTPWSVIDRAKLRQLGRRRFDEARKKGNNGARLAEIGVSRILTVARWLRDEQHIPPEACIPHSRWRDELRAYISDALGGQMPEPHRPRHTLEEMRGILEKAFAVDPRLGFLLALGAELRLGQVVRCRRSNLNLDHRTLQVPGRKKKRGTTVLLTDGQMHVVRTMLTSGYLRELEGGLPDFYLFPAGQMPGGRKGDPVAAIERHGSPEARPIQSKTWNEWFRLAEEKAEVTHLPGRAAYGLRRVAVDAAKALGISREGLQAQGGWTSSQIPDQVYAEQDAVAAQDEARGVRAKIRGEVLP